MFCPKFFKRFNFFSTSLLFFFIYLIHTHKLSVKFFFVFFRCLERRKISLQSIINSQITSRRFVNFISIHIQVIWNAFWFNKKNTVLLILATHINNKFLQFFRILLTVFYIIWKYHKTWFIIINIVIALITTVNRHITESRCFKVRNQFSCLFFIIFI